MPPLRGLSLNIHIVHIDLTYMGCGVPDGSVVKYLPANAGDTGDMGLIPGSGSFPWKKKWQPTPVFLPENPTDREVQWASVYGVTRS